MDISVEHGYDYYDYDFSLWYDFELKGLTVSQFIINMFLHYCKSLCVPKERPSTALELTTIFYTHYIIVICLIIVVLLTVPFNVKCLLMLNVNMLLSKTVRVCTYTSLTLIISMIIYYVYNAFVLSSLKLTIVLRIFINWHTLLIVCSRILSHPSFMGYDGTRILLNIDYYVIYYSSQSTKILYKHDSIYTLEIETKGIQVCHNFFPWNLKTYYFIFFELPLLWESIAPFIKKEHYQLLFDYIMFCTHVLCHLQPTCVYKIIPYGTTYFHMRISSYEGTVLFIVYVIVIYVVLVHVQVMIHTHSHNQAYLYLSTINQYLVLNNIIKLDLKCILKLINANIFLTSYICPIYWNSFEQLLLRNIRRLMILFEPGTICFIQYHLANIYYVFITWMFFMFTFDYSTLFYILITALFNNG